MKKFALSNSAADRGQESSPNRSFMATFPAALGDSSKTKPPVEEPKQISPIRRFMATFDQFVVRDWSHTIFTSICFRTEPCSVLFSTLSFQTPVKLGRVGTRVIPLKQET